MKVSRAWLQRYFEKPLPPVAELSDAFTFHAFEVEGVEGEILDLKVLPDRAGYALSHRGIAKELSAILNIPLKSDPLREPISAWLSTDKLTVKTDSRYVLRHTGALFKGVKVGPSPAWLKETLESVGQRSINNIVDASNFMMLDIGQPSHAFDMNSLKTESGKLVIDIRKAKKGEKITVLTGEEYTLADSMYVIADGNSDEPLDIAGLKGGITSGITEKTTDLFISIGNYDGTLIRKMSQALKLSTDAGQRYQNRPSPELTAYGMRNLLALIKEVAGGELIGVVDVYNQKPETRSVAVTTKQVSGLLGAEYSDGDVEDVLKRLDLTFTKKSDEFVVSPPFERTDIAIPEDLVEEVGRIIGYDRVPPTELPAEKDEKFTAHRNLIEAVREAVMAEGYNEISTYSMVEKGDVELVLPLADDKKYLRPDLATGHKKAIALNSTNLPLFNVPDLRMFEIGHVWPPARPGKGDEKFALGITYWISGKGADKTIKDELTRIHTKLEELTTRKVKAKINGNTIEFDIHELTDTKTMPDIQLTSATLSPYHPFSIYPFVLRDIAVWTPEGTTAEAVAELIRDNAGALLFRSDIFDTFSKGGKTSYAFHLVFQSMDRTLSDEEVNGHMKTVTDALSAKGWEVR
jgi:phenylalanyl-tRNA synthetase beta chain